MINSTDHRVDNKINGLYRPHDPVEGEVDMAAKKKDTYVMPPKMYWHLYSLQNLQSEKLVKVVNKILRKEFQLIK